MQKNGAFQCLGKMAFVPILAVFCLLPDSRAVLIRRRGLRAPSKPADLHSNANITDLTHALHDDISFDVVNQSSITSEPTAKCLCKMGEFWHWRINKCILQGSWGYECGFFPAEHHRLACEDGLKCQPVHSSELEGTTYFRHTGAKPASCTRCVGKDACSRGQERHETQCLKEYKMMGKACATVRVLVKASARAKASAGESTAQATAEAEAVRHGVAHEEVCVPVSTVKQRLGLQDVPKVGPVLAAEVISEGDKEAFDLAYDKATASASSAGRINAVQAAKELAAAKASFTAKLIAEAKTRNEIAWGVEAGSRDKTTLGTLPATVQKAVHATLPV